MEEAKVVGRIAEVRVNRARGRDMSVALNEKAANICTNFNSRGPGQFKMCVGATQEGVQMHLHHELVSHLKGWCEDVAPYLEFRINYNDVDQFGLTWEGFSIGGFDWIDL